MPREQIIVRGFQGLSGNDTLEDARAGTARFADGLDPRPHLSKFQGLPQDTELIGAGVNGAGFASFQDGEKAVFLVGSALKYLSVLSGTPTVQSISGTVAGSYGGHASDAHAVHIAMGRGNNPRWVGDIGGAVVQANAKIEAAASGSWSAVRNAWGTARGAEEEINTAKYPFRKDTAYTYAISLVYDTFQESPLLAVLEDQVPTDDVEDIQFTITRPASSPNTRITHIKIYRASTGASRTAAEAAQTIPINSNYPGVPDVISFPGRRALTTIDSDNYGEYTVVAQVKCNWAAGGATDDPGWSANQYAFTDDFKIGPSFKAETGYDQTLPHMLVEYDLCLRVGDFNVIAGVDLEGEDAPEMAYQVMHSLRNRFDTFDWSHNWQHVSTKPVALAHFMGRVWLFGKGVTYWMREPPAMGDPQDGFGVGAASRKSVIVTPVGMFFASDQQIYLHDRSTLRVIGDEVLSLTNSAGTDLGYAQHNTSVDPVALYDPRLNLFVLAYESGSANRAVVYHAPSDRWSHMSLPSGTIYGGLVTAFGEPMIAINSKLYKVFGSTALRSWEWLSPWYGDGDRGLMPFEIAMRGDSASVEAYETDGQGSAIAMSSYHNGKYHRGTINPEPGSGLGDAWSVVRRFSVKVSGAADKKTEQIALTYRQVGIRRDPVFTIIGEV